MPRDRQVTLTREAVSDDTLDTEHSLSVVYRVYRAEPDVGIMHDWVELDSVTEDGTNFALTEAEEAWLIAELEGDL